MATKTQNSFVPNSDAEFDAWVENYVEQISVHPDLYLINKTRIDRLRSGLTEWNTAYADAVAARDAAKAAVDVKDYVRKQLEDLVRSSARVIQADDEVTDAARDKAGLPVHKKTKTPIPVPKTHPVGTVIGTDALEQTLQYSDSKTPTKKARPYGVTGCEIYVAVGNVAPTNPDNYRFLRMVTRTPETIRFQSEDAGQLAHYLLRWVNTKGETGPWSPVISATIPAV